MASRPSPPSLDVAKLRDEISAKYREVANNPEQEFHFHHGRQLAKLLDYPGELVDKLPDSVVESFAGTGNPFSLGPINAGERVLDMGSGAGFDALIAAIKVGPGGQVIGVDMTPEMLDKARRNAASLKLSNAEFREGLAEDLPLEDGSVDVVISNGVINLCPDKTAAYRELYRVLKPGGRLMIADIIVQQAVSEEAKQDIDLWTGWIAGALLEAEHEAVIREAGFGQVETRSRDDVFAGAKGEANASQFGTQGVTIRATKPVAA